MSVRESFRCHWGHVIRSIDVNAIMSATAQLHVIGTNHVIGEVKKNNNSNILSTSYH